ncbi:MAG: EipA family protein, partial [Alphaproteobacteria bacterium]
RKNAEPRKVYWQGPSVGFDIGGNASKAFILVYHLKDTEQIYQRFPGVEGTIYFIAGVGVNYQQSGDIILAPIRTGVGLRAGANVGYLHYTRKSSLVPF